MTEPGPPAAPLPVAVALRSAPGTRRYNEDRIAAQQVGAGWCCVLSDGAGGHADGARAAEVVVESILAQARQALPLRADALGAALLGAHRALLAAKTGDAGRRDAMMATVVALTLDPGRATAVWGHVGDSRLHLFRRGRLQSVTRDDSIVQWMIDAGYLDRVRARNHENRNRLLAALGIDDEVQPSMCAPVAIEDGDAFLLCSDGWWDCVEVAHMEELLATVASPDAWLDAQAAVVQRAARPEQDNYSAVAVWIGDPLERTRLPAKPA